MALLTAGALLVTACGGSASAAPSTDPGVTGGPTDTQAPGPTVGPGQTDEVGDGNAAFGSATTALDALDSYEFRVEIATTTISGDVTAASKTVMSGVVVNAPTKASSLAQQDIDADGNVTSAMGIIVIAGDAWVSNGPDEPWTAIPAAQAEMFVQLLAGFRPEQMFALYFAGMGGNFSEAGTETKNGVQATRYTGDDAIGTLLGTIAGFQGSWKSEVWIANDGGFLVHSEASGEALTGPEAGSFTIVVDISKPNSAGPILPPS